MVLQQGEMALKQLSVLSPLPKKENYKTDPGVKDADKFNVRFKARSPIAKS